MNNTLKEPIAVSTNWLKLKLDEAFKKQENLRLRVKNCLDQLSYTNSEEIAYLLTELK